MSEDIYDGLNTLTLSSYITAQKVHGAGQID